MGLVLLIRTFYGTKVIYLFLFSFEYVPLLFPILSSDLKVPRISFSIATCSFRVFPHTGNIFHQLSDVGSPPLYASLGILWGNG